ncbi:MAG: hypothetical protein KKE24_08200 [Candidatus Thermoplasmatota archaeon]|nr:hypothetical protein [Candidatus Thermoplasmatota archaeon]
MKVTAFSPGHITGFFEICPGKDALSTGSRGAGVCISLGATSEVQLVPATKQSVKVTINGKQSRAEVTRAAISQLIGDTGMRVNIVTELDLPIGQGFGMSAAGTLSAAIATAYVMGRERQEAFEAAHIAEIECGCGLGDVSAIHRGGVTIRTRPGLPPKGEVLRVDGDREIVLAIIGKKLLTKEILENEKTRNEINSKGAGLLDSMVKDQTIERLMVNSRIFAIESGLATKKLIKAMDLVTGPGMASMSMLGNSLFAIGDVERIKERLSSVGEVRVCKIDTQGPRLV